MNRDDFFRMLMDLCAIALITLLFVGGSYLVLNEMADQQGRYEQVN